MPGSPKQPMSTASGMSMPLCNAPCHVSNAACGHCKTAFIRYVCGLPTSGQHIQFRVTSAEVGNAVAKQDADML